MEAGTLIFLNYTNNTQIRFILCLMTIAREIKFLKLLTNPLKKLIRVISELNSCN